MARQRDQDTRRRAALAAALLVALAAVCAPQAAEALPRQVRQAAAEAEVTDAAAAAEAPPAATTQAPQRAKIPAVNFTSVERLFEEALDEPQVAAKWRKMDKTLTEGVRAIIKLVFPHIVSMAQDAKVGGNCSGAILKWILNLRNMRTWAVQMLDAIGKPSAGILQGSLTLFGNHKQCLSIRAPDEDEIEMEDRFVEYFRGKYCVLLLKPPLTRKQPFYSLNSTIASLARPAYKYYEKTVYDELADLAMAFNFVSIRADLCVPSLCSRDDIQRVADYLAAKVDMRAMVQRCSVQLDDSQLDQTHLIWALAFALILLLVLISTLTSILFGRSSSSGSSSKLSQFAGRKNLLSAMSLTRSISRIRNVHLDRINDSKPVFLYSLRLLIISWIFVVSLTSQLNFQYLRELLELRDLIMLWPMQLIVNSTFAYETLILLTAFTYSYQNINSDLTDLIKYNLSKYFRLMPSIMFLAAATIITPILYQNRSPIWSDFVEEPAQVCRSNAYVNLFFLQNFLNSNQICLQQTWLFCVELQLCVLAIPIVFALNKSFDNYHGQFKLLSWPVLTLLATSVAGCAINFANTYQNQLPAAWFQTFPDKQDKVLYNSVYLFKTYSHLTSFSVGLLAGHLCRCFSLDTFSGRPYGRSCCDALMWAASLTTMTVLVYSTHSWSLSGQAHLEAPLASALYAALGQLGWALSWALILFNLTVPDEKNQRSSFANFLSGDAQLVRLGRLSFLAYLINPYVNSIVLAIQEQAIFSSILMLGHTLIGNLVLTFALSFAISALIELPCRRLFKKLLIGSRRQSSNLDIISRQLNNQGRNRLPAERDTFTSGGGGAAANANSQKAHYVGGQSNSMMIPLKQF